jgi:hypothetical protein
MIEVLKWIKTLKFPNRYVANIKLAVNVSTGKLNGLESHDYHVIMERLMSIMWKICGRCLLNLITSTGRFVLSRSQRR